MYTNTTGTPITKISWLAPTENTDGSPITDQLSYNLYIDDVLTISFPGELNPDGRYSFPLADVPAISDPATYTMELTAVDESGDESDRSNAIQVVRTETVPNSPSGFLAG